MGGMRTERQSYAFFGRRSSLEQRLEPAVEERFQERESKRSGARRKENVHSARVDLNPLAHIAICQSQDFLDPLAWPELADAL